MKTEITEILKLVKEYLSIKVEDEKERIEIYKKRDDYFDALLKGISNGFEAYVKAHGKEKVISQIFDLLGFDYSDFKKSENESQEELDSSIVNDIVLLTSFINDDLIMNLSKKYGIISGIHPLNSIPSVNPNIDNQLLDIIISLLECKRKERIIKLYSLLKSFEYQEIYELILILNDNLTIQGKDAAAHLLNLLEDEISTNRPQ